MVVPEEELPLRSRDPSRGHEAATIEIGLLLGVTDRLSLAGYDPDQGPDRRSTRRIVRLVGDLASALS